MRYFIRTCLVLAFFLFLADTYAQSKDSIQAHFSVSQCDSLILSNADNPNFVILDVRSPGEYIPEHLEGAIMRNYYSPSFQSMIDELPRHKFYLIHCRSGGRSALAFNMMADMDFTMIVNMLGGINSWKSAGFPVTEEFAPLLMAVSDTLVAPDTIPIGTSDTISLTITNRANDTLVFNSISSLSGTEFTTNFNTSTTLLGAEDYTFNIIYEPLDEIRDSIYFSINSNGGEIGFYITRTGVDATGIFADHIGNIDFEMQIFPNPSSGVTHLRYSISDPSTTLGTGSRYTIFELYNLQGIKVRSLLIEFQPAGEYKLTFDVSDLPAGMYIVKVMLDGNVMSKKLMVR